MKQQTLPTRRSWWIALALLSAAGLLTGGMMMTIQAQTSEEYVVPRGAPPIDRAVPEHLETATFALG